MIYLENAKKGSLRDEVISLIISSIAKGELKPGQKIKEAQLAEQLGISRAPIREAFRLLEQEGIIEYKPRRGTFVTEIDYKDIEQIYDIRVMIDLFCADKVLKNVTDKDIRELKVYISNMTLADSAEQFSEADYLFHKKLCNLTDHKRLIMAWSSIEFQTRMVMTNCKNLQYANAANIKLHYEILEALQEKNLNHFKESIEKHHNMAREAVIELWKKKKK